MTRQAWEFSEGDQISDTLTAVRLLGGGERFEAYLAFDDHRYCPVVVKVLRPDQIAAEAALRGLRREYRLARSLDHPVLVRAFDLVEDGPRPHLVLEHLDGPRLSSLVRRHGPLPPHQLLPLGIEVASALHYLHREGVVHLDVKPSNIIMGAPPRLIDLSIARPVEAAARLDYSVGTDRYLAPEQADPPHSGVPGPPADIFGLGATLFEAHAGYRPLRTARPTRIRRPSAGPSCCSTPGHCRTRRPTSWPSPSWPAWSATRPTGRRRPSSPNRSDPCWPVSQACPGRLPSRAPLSGPLADAPSRGRIQESCGESS